MFLLDMAGIFGITYAHPGRDPRASAARLAHAFRMPNALEQRCHYFLDGAIGAVPRTSDTPTLLLSDEGKSAFAILGTMYLPNGTPLNKSNFQKKFLDPFLASGSIFLRELTGGFCFALMKEGECILANDPFGNYMLHYAANKEHLIFSNRMMSLRDLLSSSFDDIGLLQHLGISQSLNGRTFYEGINRLPRGTVLRYCGGNVFSEEYITRHFHPSSDISGTLETIRLELSNSIERVIPSGSNVAAALTGGFDSRMTWSMILGTRLAPGITAHTHGLPNARDLQIARQIARKLGLRHDALEFDKKTLQSLTKLWREFITLTEGLQPITQIHSYYATRHLSCSYDTLIDSSAGPLYRRQIKKFIEPRIDPRKNLAMQVLPFEQTALATSKLIRPEVRKEMSEAALLGLQEYYETIEHIPEIGDRFDLFYADQTAALRASIEGNLQANFINLEQPLFNLKALEAVAQIPGKIRRREGIHRYVIRNSYPKLEQFTMDYSGYFAPYRGFSTLRLVAPGLDKIIQICSRRFFFQHPASFRRPPFDTQSALLPGIAQAREMLLSPHRQFSPLVDRNGVEQSLKSFEDRPSDSAAALLQLLTFRMFLDIYC